MGAVEERLTEILDDAGEGGPTGARRIRRASRHLALAPAAKRARPRLAFHFGRSVGLDTDLLVGFAVAAELVHTASLLHDDVVDEGSERRERETVHNRWNDVTAVLTGDALLCSALHELREAVPAVTHRAVDVVSEMTRSILHEVASRRRTDLDREDWEYVATGKTGALFGWCGVAPALEARSPTTAERLDECGRRLGVAFQLADDLRDLVPAESGKDSYADIDNGNLSFPIICAVEECDSLAQRLEAHWSSSRDSDDFGTRAEDIAGTIRQTSAMTRTRRRIRAEVDRALSALGPCAERPGGAEVADWARRLCARI